MEVCYYNQHGNRYYSDISVIVSLAFSCICCCPIDPVDPPLSADGM